MSHTIHHGDMLDVLAAMEPNSVDSIVCDPPYGLSFMELAWDHGVPGPEYWKAALRVLRPGGHMLAFGGTRTYHRLTCAIEDAGWEIRDCMMWLYGSGFTKSHNISKAIDREAGAEREKVLVATGYGNKVYCADSLTYSGPNHAGFRDISAPITDAAKQWDGWGTALKPAWEPIIVARKPLEGTVAQNVLKHGTGGINIDGCRIGTAEDMNPADFDDRKRSTPKFSGRVLHSYEGRKTIIQVPNGRWPANLMHDGSEEVLAGFPETAPNSRRLFSDKTPTGNGVTHGAMRGIATVRGHDDNGGSAARFFYCAKASKKDRGEANSHPMVKPTELLRYLCRLVTPPQGLILDPFMGSGSTGKAALLEGFRFVGVEREEEYVRIAATRLSTVDKQDS